jgi:outer membrane protein OmpA-like peptidoglycan-associated protein
MTRIIPAALFATAALLSGCSGGFPNYPGDKDKVAVAEDQRWTMIHHETSDEYSVPDHLLFATDSAQVLPAGHRIIAELADVAKRHGGHVEVDGFTDTVGSARHNDKLSIARAESVATELAQAGVERERIETRGFGERELAVETPDQTPEAKNRRVVVKIANG